MMGMDQAKESVLQKLLKMMYGQMSKGENEEMTEPGAEEMVEGEEMPEEPALDEGGLPDEMPMGETEEMPEEEEEMSEGEDDDMSYVKDFMKGGNSKPKTKSMTMVGMSMSGGKAKKGKKKAKKNKDY